MVRHLEWKDEYCVGFEPIDAQHKTLVQLLDELYGAALSGAMTRPQFERILDRLLLYTETHMDYEETVYRYAGVPGMDAHVRLHEDMKLRTKGLSLALRGDLDDQVRHALNVVCDWWLNHILLEDHKAVPYLKQAFD